MNEETRRRVIGATATNRYQRQRALLAEAVADYVEHQNWRCSDKRCRCGLDDFERRVREALADG